MLLNDPQGFSFKCHSRMSKGIKTLWLEIDHSQGRSGDSRCLRFTDSSLPSEVENPNDSV